MADTDWSNEVMDMIRGLIPSNLNQARAASDAVQKMQFDLWFLTLFGMWLIAMTSIALHQYIKCDDPDKNDFIKEKYDSDVKPELFYGFCIAIGILTILYLSPIGIPFLGRFWLCPNGINTVVNFFSYFAPLKGFFAGIIGSKWDDTFSIPLTFFSLILLTFAGASTWISWKQSESCLEYTKEEEYLIDMKNQKILFWTNVGLFVFMLIAQYFFYKGNIQK